MRTTIQQSWYRNGQLREEMPLRNGKRHGVARLWHKNGRLASEERYANGLLHGICRQWNESGRLLGQYRMVQGTGVQRVWHDNGKPQMELSSVHGEFCGRSRSWLRDGTLLADEIFLCGKLVNVDAYRVAATKDKSLPKLGRARRKALKPVSEQHIHRVFIAAQLAKPNGREARVWLEEKSSGRALGRFKRQSDAAKFVAALYNAGASKVIAPDVYRSKKGEEFADALLVRLPKSADQRKAIRNVCAQLPKRKLGAVQPDADMGEAYLFLSLA
ncbi:MAG TPA: toxin-antitoxin system YwqK family antitoxin [Verrucomicrobiota bacterium]|nr:toxin-antitoxin system YwqK family antitoxin [Verrucomicrobiota bacterium]